MAGIFVTVVEDLFFLAKIQETAKAIGVRVIPGDARGGSAAIASAQPQAIILDLNLGGWAPIEYIQTLKADPATRPIRIVAFASHVYEELIASAYDAGCDVVMTRSAFTQQLPKLLNSL